MFCPVCGAAAPDNAAFCGKCGADLSRFQASAANQPEAVQGASTPQQPTAASEQWTNTQSAAASGQWMNNQPTMPVPPPADTAKKARMVVDFPGSWIRRILIYIPFALVMLSFIGR